MYRRTVVNRPTVYRLTVMNRPFLLNRSTFHRSDACWPKLTHADTSWHMLAPANPCWPMPTHADPHRLRLQQRFRLPTDLCRAFLSHCHRCVRFIAWLISLAPWLESCTLPLCFIWRCIYWPSIPWLESCTLSLCFIWCCMYWPSIPWFESCTLSLCFIWRCIYRLTHTPRCVAQQWRAECGSTANLSAKLIYHSILILDW